MQSPGEPRFLLYSPVRLGGVPEWLKGADCKSVGLRLRWFESSLLHQVNRVDEFSTVGVVATPRSVWSGGSSSMVEP